MTCDEIRELGGAFAADALDGAARDELLEHLRTCDAHPELAELRAAAIALAVSGDDVSPPAGLRERVLAAGRDRTEEPVRGRWPVMPMGIAAAVVALIAVGIVAFIVVGGGDDGLHSREFSTGAGIHVWLETRFGEAATTLRFEGLEQPPEGEEYVAWVVRGSDWLRVGSFSPGGDGAWAGEFAFALEEGDALCLTLSGSETPQQPFGVPLFMEPVQG